MLAKRTSFLQGPIFFLLPALILYIIFVITPLCGTVLLTFTKWRGESFRTLEYIGLTNYINLLSDSIFLKAFKNTFIFVSISVSLQCTLGLAVALLLEQNVFLGTFFRGSYFIPATISLVIVGITFEILFNPALGILRELLKPIGLHQLAGFGWWFADRKKAIFALSLVQVWYGFGWSMFIFISGLKAIDIQLYEAAEVDGASELKKIVYISLPLLKGTTSVAVLLATMWALRVYSLPYVVTRGGPGHASEVISTWAYYNAFHYQRVGYGSAIAMVLLILGVAVSFLMFRFTAVGKTE